MSDYEKYFGKVLHFLSFRPRSEKEIKDFLIKKKTPEEVSEKILKFLLEQRLVNDEEFVRWWIQQRNRFSPKGERLVRLELRQKGIAQDVIDAIFEEKKSQDDGAEEGKSQDNDTLSTMTH